MMPAYYNANVVMTEEWQQELVTQTQEQTLILASREEEAGKIIQYRSNCNAKKHTTKVANQVNTNVVNI